MGSRTKRVAFIPVRGGSKSIPKKNIKLIAGKPLVYWVIDAVFKSESFDEIYISTDDSEIKNVVQQHPDTNELKIIERSKETATDTATTESAMLEFATQNDFQYIALIQATSPLIVADDIRKAMKKFFEAENIDSLLTVCRQERFIWKQSVDGIAKPVNYNPLNRPRRQEFDGFLVENGALYITDRESLLKSKNRLSGNITTYEMPAETYYELDESSDWSIIEKLLEKRNIDSLSQKLKGIKLFLTDVDGVLTDAGMYYSERGDELKKFNTRDGKGLELLRSNGIEVGIVTSEDTQIVTNRASKLNVEILYQGIKNKGKLLSDILEELNLQEHQVAYIGDDVNDISIMERVGFTAAPADAMKKVKAEVDYICNKKGGEGCVREVSELIINIHSDGRV